MRVGFYQFSPAFGQIQQNLEKIAGALQDIDAELIVLPELANSGYLFLDQGEVDALAEPIPGPTTEFLQRLAQQLDTHLVLGMPERAGGGFFNSSVLVGPGGVLGVYRKVHLFYEEKLYFQPGDLGFPVYEVGGVKVGMLICFDHLFPEAARSLALQGVQLVCHPSNLVLPTKAQMSTRVRAMENRIFWVMCNRYGSEDRGRKQLKYTGDSQIADPDGGLLSHAAPEGDCLSVVEIDPEVALDKSITRYNDVLADRRAEAYSW